MSAILAEMKEAAREVYAEERETLLSAIRVIVAQTQREDPDTILGLAEVARRLHKSEPAVRKLLQRGRLPGRKLGRLWQVRLGDLVGVKAGE